MVIRHPKNVFWVMVAILIVIIVLVNCGDKTPVIEEVACACDVCKGKGKRFLLFKCKQCDGRGSWIERRKK